MQRKSVFVIAALAAGLMLGLVLGPQLGNATANAQTQPATAPGTLQSLFLDKLAAALNIQRPALNAAITNAGNATADDAVKQGTLTQAQADALKTRLQAGDYGALFDEHGVGDRDEIGGKAAHGAVHQAIWDAAAKALNLSTTELQTQLRSGQTIAQIAQAKGTTEQAVVTAALAAAKTQLAQQVTSGTLTQAQADADYAQLQQRGAQIFEMHQRGPHGGGNRTAPGSPQAPGATAPAGV